MAAAALTSPGDQAGSGSNGLQLLIVIAVCLGLGYAGVRLWRRHQRRQLEALWRRRDATWRAVVRQIEMEREPSASKPSAERQRIDVG